MEHQIFPPRTPAIVMNIVMNLISSKPAMERG